MTASVKTGKDTPPDQESTIADWLNISHELRTPANAILGHTELLMSGVMGPLPNEARASLGDIQRAGRDLVVQISKAIEVGQELSSPGSAAETDMLFEGLRHAWSKAYEPVTAAVDFIRPDGEEIPRHQPTCWLRVIAILLQDLSASPADPSQSDNAPTAKRVCDIDHSHLSELRLDYLFSARHDVSIKIEMIETAVKMTGGAVDHLPNKLVLFWPDRKDG